MSLEQNAAYALVKSLSGVAKCPTVGCQQLGQELFEHGDFPDELFCPHCDTNFKIEVIGYFDPPEIETEQ